MQALVFVQGRKEGQPFQGSIRGSQEVMVGQQLIKLSVGSCPQGWLPHCLHGGTVIPTLGYKVLRKGQREVVRIKRTKDLRHLSEEAHFPLGEVLIRSGIL